MENSQEAQRWQHVTCALLKHKLVHVKERVLVIFFFFTPTVLILLFLLTLFSDLRNRKYIIDYISFVFYQQKLVRVNPTSRDVTIQLRDSICSFKVTILIFFPIFSDLFFLNTMN